MRRNSTEEALRDYDRALIKSGVVSLFWTAIADKKRRGKYTLQNLADALGKNKSTVSRWFSKPPNWQLETIADIASALDMDIEIRARDRSTGRIFTPSGPEAPIVTLGKIVQPSGTGPSSSALRLDPPAATSDSRRVG